MRTSMLIPCALISAIVAAQDPQLDYRRFEQRSQDLSTGAALSIGLGAAIGSALFMQEDNLQEAGIVFMTFSTSIGIGLLLHGAADKHKATKLRARSLSP